MPTVIDIFSDITRDYKEARKKYGANPKEIFIALKKQVKKGNIKAVETQIKIDRQWPAEQREIDFGSNTLAHLDSHELTERLSVLVSMLSDDSKKELINKIGNISGLTEDEDGE